MANPCGQVHMPNMACRECDRVRTRDATLEAASILPNKPEAGADESASREAVPVISDGRDEVSPETKPDRLAVAREAAADVLTRYRAKNAARQKRYRERKRLGHDPPKPEC